MKKLLLITLLTLGASQAMASNIQVCPSWGCTGIPTRTLVSKKAELQAHLAAVDQEIARIALSKGVKRGRPVYTAPLNNGPIGRPVYTSPLNN